MNKNRIEYADFLKIDVQGYELSVLKGAKNSLKDVIGIEVEVEFAKIYKDQPCFTSIHEFLESQGFTLFDLRRTYWNRDAGESCKLPLKGQLIFGDALYFRDPESILQTKTVSKEVVLRAFFIYMAYGYFELCESLLASSTEAGVVLDATRLRKILNREMRSLKVPRFRGRARLKSILDKMSALLEEPKWYSGTDTKLGNV